MIKKCKCGASQQSKKAHKPIVDKVGIGSALHVICNKCLRTGMFSSYADEAIYNWNKESK